MSDKLPNEDDDCYATTEDDDEDDKADTSEWKKMEKDIEKKADDLLGLSEHDWNNPQAIAKLFSEVNDFNMNKKINAKPPNFNLVHVFFGLVAVMISWALKKLWSGEEALEKAKGN